MRDKHLIYIEINATNNHGTPQPAVFMRDKECLQYRGEEWWEAGHDNDEVIFEQEDDVENSLGGTHTSISMSFPKMPETHGCQTIGHFKDGDNVRLRCGHVIVRTIENAYAIAPYNDLDGYWGDICEECFTNADLMDTAGEQAEHQFRTPAEQEGYDDRAMFEEAGVVPNKPVDLLADKSVSRSGAYGIAEATHIIIERGLGPYLDGMDGVAEAARLIYQLCPNDLSPLLLDYSDYVGLVVDDLVYIAEGMDADFLTDNELDVYIGVKVNDLLEQKKPAKYTISRTCSIEVELGNEFANKSEDEIIEYLEAQLKDQSYGISNELNPVISFSK